MLKAVLYFIFRLFINITLPLSLMIYGSIEQIIKNKNTRLQSELENAIN